MATEKQKKAAHELVGNGGNVTKAMRDVGYSENTLNTPQKLTESKGFKEVCDDLGLTDDFIVQALVDDIIALPKNRSRELALAIKVKGLEKTAIDITSLGEKLPVAESSVETIARFSEFMKKDTKQ